MSSSDFCGDGLVRNTGLKLVLLLLWNKESWRLGGDLGGGALARGSVKSGGYRTREVIGVWSAIGGRFWRRSVGEGRRLCCARGHCEMILWDDNDFASVRNGILGVLMGWILRVWPMLLLWNKESWRLGGDLGGGAFGEGKCEEWWVSNEGGYRCLVGDWGEILAAERWRGAEALWNFGSFDGLDLARLAYAAAME